MKITPNMKVPEYTREKHFLDLPWLNDRIEPELSAFAHLKCLCPTIDKKLHSMIPVSRFV